MADPRHQRQLKVSGQAQVPVVDDVKQDGTCLRLGDRESKAEP